MESAGHRARARSIILGVHHLPPPVTDLARRQDGVVCRRQLRGLGADDADVRRWRSQRLLSTAADGVYVDHTGDLSTRQRDWAAVLLLWPAVLGGASALAVDGLSRSLPRTGLVRVAVEAHRTPRAPDWIDPRRVVGLRDRARWQLSPPRDAFEDAVLDVLAEARDELAVVGVLAEAVSSRRTTPDRLRAALERRTRMARRALVTSVLTDLATGACSVLERAYLRDVERAHRLPRGLRQTRGTSHGRVYRDVDLPAYGLLIELDGRADHTHLADRDRDLDRDLDAAAKGKVTVRLGWGQVLGRACRTAARLDALLRQRGWAGRMTRCRHCPPPGIP